MIIQENNIIKAGYKKITLRLIPFLFVCYLFNYFDRVNVGFAKLHMLDDLGLSETVYGLGAGIFFVGYFLFGIPSNLILQKIGARRWICIMMIAWGTLSTCMLFVNSATSFYVLRFFTGISEAGFFPGIVYYFTRWFTSARRGRIMALFMSAIPISGIIGGPFSGWILDHFSVGYLGMNGWQWLFLLQGFPTVFLGIAVYFFLKDDISQATWLTDDERSSIQQILREEEQQKTSTDISQSFLHVLKNSRVWLLAVIYLCIQMGVYAVSFWLPSIIKNLGFDNALSIGWISAIPYLAAVVFMIIVGRSADTKHERRWHLIIPMACGAIGLMLSAIYTNNAFISVLSLTIAVMGIFTALPMFWPLPAAFLGTMAAAGGLALINSMGNLAGFLSPYLVGWIKDVTQSTDIALYILSSILLLGAILVTQVPKNIVNK